MANPSAVLENWYQDPATGKTFRVVALDKAADSIEIQYFNGDLGDYDFASWSESNFQAIAPPEDWSGPYDDLELDDMGYSDPDSHPSHAQGFTLDDLLDADDER
jgi:hypothetical protein